MKLELVSKVIEAAKKEKTRADKLYGGQRTTLGEHVAWVVDGVTGHIVTFNCRMHELEDIAAIRQALIDTPLGEKI
jgi:hypothetical protein